MIKRIYLVILVLLFATPGIFAQQTITIGDVIAGPGTIEVPVYMNGFTNVNGFQLAFNVDPNILNPVKPDDDSYFVSGSGKTWMYNVITEEEFVIQFLDMGYSTVGGVAVFNTHTINGEVFRLKFTYNGGFPADIDFNVGNSQVMVNGGSLNLNNVNFLSGTVAPDPDVVLGTLKLEGEAEAVIGTEYVVPFSIQGDGFGAIRGIQVELSFDPNKLVFNGLDNVPGSGIAFDAIQNGNLISFVWIGDEIDFTDEKTIANLRFTYNSNDVAVVDFTANTRVSTALGEIAYAHESATFTPKDLDLKLTIEDVYQYSGANVDIPIVLSGVEDDITAGSITIRLGFDSSLMSYASMESSIDFNPPTLTDGVVVLNFVAGPDDEGYKLANGTIATLRFNFLDTGMTNINYLFGPSGTAFTTFEGGVIPISYVNGSAEVSVPGIVYDGLLDAREKTTLVLTNPAYNEIVETTTYPDTFITSTGAPFFFDVITDSWMLDGFLEFSEDLPAGTILTLGFEGESIDVVLEDGLEAHTLLSYKDMVLSALPEENVDWPLLDEAENQEVWTISFRSPLTVNVTMTSVLSVSHDGFVASEDGQYPGFVLAMDAIDFTIHGDPQLLFAFNGELASTDSEFEYCYDVPVSVTLDSKLEGGTSFDITYTVNGEETALEGVEVGDVIWGPGLLEAGTYEVVVTSIIDNFGRDVVNPQDIYKATVVIHPMPEADVTADGDLEFCDGGAVMLTVSESVEYLWNNGETTQSITVTESGVFYVTVTDENGCTNTSDEVEVIVNPLPEAVITADGDLEFCDGGSVVLTASEGVSYLWSNEATTRSITVTDSGVFSVIVTDDKGCSNTSEEVTVVVNELPVATIAVEGELSFCDGGSVVLTASEAASYLWSNAETTQNITVTESGLFSVTVTDAKGCSATSDAVTVTVFELPVVTCRADTVVMLSHEPFDLAGSTPAGGVYSGPGVADGKFTANAATAGVGTHEITYTVTSTDGCVVACTFTIEVKLDTSVPGEVVQSTIRLYPNPARTELYIEANDDIKEIRMVDMLGQVVFAAGIQQPTYELNVSTFKSGIYFVQILTEKGFTTHRVQVTR